MNADRKISVIGLGYVGLPVAAAFGNAGKPIGYDINQTRIQKLGLGHDCTGEVTTEELLKADILFTDNIEVLRQADFHMTGFALLPRLDTFLFEVG